MDKAAGRVTSQTKATAAEARGSHLCHLKGRRGIHPYGEVVREVACKFDLAHLLQR